MTTFITHFDQEITSRDMSAPVALGTSLFIASCFTGFYLYDMYMKNKKMEERVKDVEEKILELETLHHTNEEVLLEHEVRIREKKDYDEFEEIEEGKYQAWSGFYQGDFYLSIQLWREGFHTFKKNQDWVRDDQVSTALCDYYLGNRNPDFDWKEKDGCFQVLEEFVDGWENIIRLRIKVECEEKKCLSEFVSEEAFQGDHTLNTVLKTCMEQDKIHWTRILFDA
jgi:hypothetical protein